MNKRNLILLIDEINLSIDLDTEWYFGFDGGTFKEQYVFISLNLTNTKYTKYKYDWIAIESLKSLNELKNLND